MVASMAAVHSRGSVFIPMSRVNRVYRTFCIGTATAVLHAVADRFLVNIQTDVVHSLHGGASLVVSESARSLSSAFLHQALLHDLFIQTTRPEPRILLRRTTLPAGKASCPHDLSALGQISEPNSINQRFCEAPLVHWSFAYSVLASFRMGMSGSASFHKARKSWYAARALATSPWSAYARPSWR